MIIRIDEGLRRIRTGWRVGLDEEGWFVFQREGNMDHVTRALGIPGSVDNRNNALQMYLRRVANQRWWHG